MTIKQKKILFIDDEKICHVFAELVIPNFTEYQLISAFDGEEAILLAKRYANDLGLVFSDIMLPGIDGYGVYESFQQDSRLAKIPFVFQSGLASREKELEERFGSLKKIIYKPYKQEELLNVIKEYAI